MSSKLKVNSITNRNEDGPVDFPDGITTSSITDANQTDWIDVSSHITNVSGASNLSVPDAWARVHVDGNGQYSVEFSSKITHDSTGGNITLQFAGVLASYGQALTTSPRATGTAGSAAIEISGGASRIYLNSTGARTNGPISGTFLVSAKPTWAP